MTTKERAASLVNEISAKWRNLYMEGWDDDEAYHIFKQAINAAVRDEKERCAKVAEELRGNWSGTMYDASVQIAAAIRGGEV